MNHELLPATASKEDMVIFKTALEAVIRSGIPFTVGGAIAVRAYSGVWRDTHDLDLFIKPELAGKALEILQSVGLQLAGSDPKWLYVTKKGTTQMDIIFAFRNQVDSIDDLWIERGREATVASVPVLVASPEDTIYSKTFIMNRERFDWGDCINIIAGLKGKIDWDFLSWRLRDYPGLLLAELFFCFQVYPLTREWIPKTLLDRLYHNTLSTKPVNELEALANWFFAMDIVQRVPPDGSLA